MNLENHYKKKYIKYKIKYLNLLKLNGGGEKTAKKYFYAQIKKNYDVVQDIFNSDKFLKNLIIKELNLPNKTEIDSLTLEQLQKNQIFSCIFNYIKSNVGKDYIDFFLKIYLTNNLGSPNSIENIGRFLDGIEKFILLRNNHMIKDEDKDKYKDFNAFTSLTNLEKFIDDNQENLRTIYEKNNKKEKEKEKQKKIKEEGENDVIIELNTDKVIIYNPTTEKGSKYYGRNTRWCTASENGNMYNYYRDMGPLYIIQSKENPTLKFQLHFQTDQYMDVTDKHISLKDIKNKFNDIGLTNWIDCIFYEYLNYRIKNNEFINISDLFKLRDISFNMLRKLFTQVEKLNIDINAELRGLLNRLINLKELTFGKSFDQSVQMSLIHLINLETLNFGDSFNQPIGTSLETLTNLKKITFGNRFNQPLETSLDTLINLETLNFGDSFNQTLGTSLKTLINLKELTFGERFNQPLGTSLETLINLKKITFGQFFNQPLGTSLETLINLKKITFGYDFNQSIEPLKNLTNLKQITFGYGDTTEETDILTKITFGGGFNQPLGTSLENFISLKELCLSQKFNQSLGSSLENLINLEKLIFGEKFNQSLESSLKNLINLRELSFGFNFNQPLGLSLENLINLEKLTFGKKFNQPLEMPLQNLINLKELTLLKNFDNLTSTSFIALKNLEILYITGDFDYKLLTDNLIHLTKLKELTVSEDIYYDILDYLQTSGLDIKLFQVEII
jgi:hypothetical protein